MTTTERGRFPTTNFGNDILFNGSVIPEGLCRGSSDFFIKLGSFSSFINNSERRRFPNPAGRQNFGNDNLIYITKPPLVRAGVFSNTLNVY